MLLPLFRWLPSKKPQQKIVSVRSRATRFKLEIPVSFGGDGFRFEGHCLNVSDTGLLARFNEPPELWIDGELLMEAGGHYLTLYARVARRNNRDVGFAFCINNDNDRASVAILINSVLDSPLPDL